MRSKLSYIIGFFFLILHSFKLSAENKTFELIGITADNNTPLANVRVTVYEGTIFMTQYSTSANGKFSFALEFNKNFKITLEKTGYASEDVSINTNLPLGFPEQNMSHQLSLKMFALSKENFPFTFEEPVAKIFFNQVIKGFTSEMNYQKTFQTKEKDPTIHDRLGNSGISEEYKFELSLRRNPTKKKDETKAVEETTTASTKPEEQKKEAPKEYRDLRTKTNKETTESIASNKKTVTESKVEKNKITATKTQVEPLKEEVSMPKKKEEINNSENSVKSAKNEKLLALYEEQKKSARVEPAKKEYKNNDRETLIERTRIIKRVVILKNEKSFEYTEITYKNGGVYYFKNGSSISAEVFNRETKAAK